MAKSKSSYYCTECGNQSAKWLGRCPACQEWGTLEEEIAIPRDLQRKIQNSGKGSAEKLKRLSEITMESSKRYQSGMTEFDRVLGGGLLEGEVVLLTGSPGIGKSTLLLQVASCYTQHGSVLYISGEESPTQIKNRSERLGIQEKDLLLFTETDILSIYECLLRERPKVVVIDSIQTIYNAAIDSISGTPTQIRECTLKIIELAKNYGISFFVVGHITKDGKVAGPKILEHMVDAVFNFEGEEGLYYRILRSTKNRFGSTNELAIFSMEEDGMKEIKNSSEYFLSERDEKNIGSVVVPVLEGTKVFLLETQSLLTEVSVGIPKRVVQGYDRNRLQILIAIAERKLSLPLGLKDVFINVPGGLSIADPAADLALLISVLSAYHSVAISQKIAAVGELGLRGEIRKVFFLEKRLRELEKLGFQGVYVPEMNRMELEKKKYKLKIIYLKNIDELLERIR